MVLIDTSSWIHMLRVDGNKSVRARVEALLESGAACWCPMIRLELWNGAGERDKKALRDFERHLPELPINDGVWESAYAFAQKARAAGVTVPGSEVLIAACAKFHALDLEYADSDFDRLLGLER